MQLSQIILIAVAAYFFLVFAGIRLVVPFMGFSFRLPKVLPEEIKSKIRELDARSANQEEYLKEAYDFVCTRWHAARMGTIFFAFLAFRKNLVKIWNKPGFAHCNTQNYMLFVLLADSKFFKASAIVPRYVFFNFFIHQYLKVKVGTEWVNVDPAGASIRGMELGTHISLFG